MKKRNSLHAAAFLAPSMAGFLLLAAVPIILSFIISLTSWSGLKQADFFSAAFWNKNFVGLQNYRDILSGGEFFTSLLHVGYFMIIYMPLMLTASMGIALLLNKPVKGSVFYRILFYIPVLTSWVAGAIIWKWVLSPEYGPVNDFLRMLGIQGPGWLQDEHWAMPAIALASVWKDMGFYALIFLGGLKGINPQYYEAAQMDGAGRVKRFFKITLPMLTPILFFVLIMSLINAFMLFPQVMIMSTNGDAGPNGATQVVVERIYKYGFKYYQLGYASAMSWLLFIVVFIFTFIQQKLQAKWVNFDA